MFKVGDEVKIKPGLVGAGMRGVVQRVAPWNLDSPYPDLRENFCWLIMEDGVKYHFHWSTLEKVTEGA
jgi:hypothetical protein